MLPKKERLSREAFNRFFSVGRRIHSPSLQLVYSPYTTLHASVVVPKKVEKSAVKRNKIRRRVYDVIRNYHMTKPLSGVFIVLVKPAVTTLDYQALKEEVVTLITQTNKIR